MTWVVGPDGHKWSGHMFNGSGGRGCGYSASPMGCEVYVYGIAAAAPALEAALDKIVASVLEAQPLAKVTRHTLVKDGRIAGAVVASIHHDEIAVFRFGPMHRQAIATVRGAASNAYRGWTDPRCPACNAYVTDDAASPRGFRALHENSGCDTCRLA